MTCASLSRFASAKGSRHLTGYIQPINLFLPFLLEALLSRRNVDIDPYPERLRVSNILTEATSDTKESCATDVFVLGACGTESREAETYPYKTNFILLG
jgi:hypothetical protein